MSARGRLEPAVARIVSRLVSLNNVTSPAASASRSARNLTCSGDSSPETYSAGRPPVLQSRRHLEQQGRLPGTWLATQQNHRAWHHAAAQDEVELAQVRPPTLRFGPGDVAHARSRRDGAHPRRDSPLDLLDAHCPSATAPAPRAPRPACSTRRSSRTDHPTERVRPHTRCSDTRSWSWAWGKIRGLRRSTFDLRNQLRGRQWRTR